MIVRNATLPLDPGDGGLGGIGLVQRLGHFEGRQQLQRAAAGDGLDVEAAGGQAVSIAKLVAINAVRIAWKDNVR